MVNTSLASKSARKLDLLSDAARTHDLVDRATTLVNSIAITADPFAIERVQKGFADYSMLNVESICTMAEQAAEVDSERFAKAYGEFYGAMESLDRTISQVEILEEAGRLDDEPKVTAACDLIRTCVADLRYAVRNFDQSAGTILARAHVETLPLPEKATDQAILQSAAVDTTNIAKVAASQLAISNAYYENVLSQARRSFNAAIVAAVLGLFLFLAAVGAALAKDSVPASIISALSGAVVETIAGLNFWLYARTSVQLDAFHLRLERMQRYLVANSVCESLRGKSRDVALADLVRTIANDRGKDPGDASEIEL